MVPPPSSAANGQNTFAWESVVKRWPVILTDIISFVHDHLDEGDKAAQGKQLINNISELKYRIAHNRPIEPLREDGESSVAGYNAELERLNRDGRGSWVEGPWLYNECYMYRYLRALFLQYPAWRDVDPFEKSKTSSFASSGRAVFTLAKSLEDLISGHVAHEQDDRLRHAAFLRLTQSNLWGNASGDLSLFAGLSASDIDALQNEDSDARSSNIICNHLDAAWAHLNSLRGARIDIVLDNSGFELFTDLVVADWLLSTPYCSRVVFHPKLIPWFVSDVMPKDFRGILNQLSDPSFLSSHSPSSEEVQALRKVVERWRGYVDDGRFALGPESHYWTGPSAFWTLPDEAPELLSDLSKAGLVIFKGDLNYRKLTGDLEWPHDTPFETALGQLAGKLDLLALRTCKADVVVGLQRGQADELYAKDKRWRWNGKYGIIAFSPRQSDHSAKRG